MAITISGSHGDYDNAKDTFPLSSALTGGTTIDAVDDGTLIVGTGTLFNSEVQIGQYLYIPAYSEFRKIRQIISDTELRLFEPFTTTTFSNQTARVTPLNTYRMISWQIDNTGTAKIDNITFPAGSGDTAAMLGGKRPEPILIDSTGAGNNVNISFSI